MTNFEVLIKNNPQYVKEILAHHVLESDLKNAIYDNRKSYVWYNDKHTSNKDGMNFLNEKYTLPVLDKIEREYLKNIVTPFRHKVRYIKKVRYIGKYYIKIMLSSEYISLPCFSANLDMYKGMKLEKEYTLKELGLL